VDSAVRLRDPTQVKYRYVAGELQVKDGYLLVQDRDIPDVEVAEVALAQIDAVLTSTKLRRLVFDTRELNSPSDAVNSMYWEWVIAGANHDRVALLVKSEMKRVEGNMRALSKRVRLRSFHDLTEAAAWLMK
jgi:hypothetical protein